jgi:hypothetical protein
MTARLFGVLALGFMAAACSPGTGTQSQSGAMGGVGSRPGNASGGELERRGTATDADPGAGGTGGSGGGATGLSRR